MNMSTSNSGNLMYTLTVALGERSYPIHIGQGILDQPAFYRPFIQADSALTVTNTTLAPLYLDRVTAMLADLRQYDALVLPDGEQYKTLDTLNQVYSALLERQYGRSTTLIALGGGVIGDITGMAAATYQRGIDFIQVPTSLLAQVDSAVGGKTGVNHPLGKNMIGAFHQPRCVIIDTDTLNTLADRELRAGLAEVIKYGAIGDAAFLDWLEAHIPDLLARDAEALGYAIKRACDNKAAVVAADERESGRRALLNFGHTFGHAIETGLGYGNWLHGEAVACGMLMAARMSAYLGWLPDTSVQRLAALLELAKLPVVPPRQLSPARWRELMAVDKKVVKGQLRLVLLRALGDATVTADYDPAALERTLTA